MPAQSDAKAPGLRLKTDVYPQNCRVGGQHLLVDLWQAKGLDNPEFIASTLRDAARAAGATVLHEHFHRFSPTGVSGVVVLAESHISIHSWPEQEYAAVDIFMCGDCKPELALTSLKLAFRAKRCQVQRHLRGIPDLMNSPPQGMGGSEDPQIPSAATGRPNR